MASTSIVAADVASSSHTAAVSIKKHEVFISFRGEDTRDNFTSHLYSALREHNIETYIDYRIEKGDEVWPTLEQAIHDSSVFLVIFSENYASSTWCLNELVEIMECKENGEDNVNVIPVFYKIEPRHVRKQTGSYEKAFDKHDQDFRHNNKTQKWKETLTKAANISGFDSNSREYRSESDMIGGIIKLVLQKLNCKHSYELRDHFIPDNNFAEIKSLLSIESTEVQIVGMWGMGGIGKTTIAEAIFCEIASQYQGACFLANIREKSKGHCLNYIYNIVLSELLRDDIHIDTSNAIPSFIVNRLRRKKVLIVLDDVDSSEVITKLVGVRHDSLGAGSIVIVTTRNKHVLIRGGVVNIHEVKRMNFQNSIQLFSLNAFDKTDPEKRFEELSDRAVNYAKGIPLALKVLGSFLRSKSENEWEDAFKKLKKYPNSEIHGVLKLSYDELDGIERKIFLDIACFFKGKNRYTISSVLNACDFYADIGIRSLLDKALITISLENCIEMHDLIQKMGHEIVCCESPDNPAQRSRLWDSREVCDMLTNNKGTNTVESVFLDMSQITDLHLSSHAFSKMLNLRLLAFDKGWISNNDVIVSIPKGFEMPRSLIFLQWDNYPLKSLPSICFMEKLVVLSMRESNVEKLWNGVQNFPSLKEIDLGRSKHLRESPNLSGSPNLITLCLDYCNSLRHVDPSVFSLPKFQILKMDGCKALKRLCSNTCSPSLRILWARECTNLQEFSVTLSADQCNISLGMSGLNKVPSSILHLRNIENFCFPICESLRDLPENFVSRSICLSDPSNHECDVSIMLRTVLPSPIFRNVRYLFFNVETLFDLPHNILLLSSLEVLSLQGSSVESLPENMKHLPRLKYLNVDHCKMLRSVPALPQSIQFFSARDCISLKTVLNSKTEPPFQIPMCTVIFANCISLDQYAFDNIVKDAISRIEHAAKLLPALTLEHAYSDDVVGSVHYLPKAVEMSGRIKYYLPAIGKGVGECFHYSSTQGSFTIELPPNFKSMGFIFYCVIPQRKHYGYFKSIGCLCYLEKSKGKRVEIKSCFIYDFPWFDGKSTSDYVCLWYDEQCCKEIMEAIKETTSINDRSTTYNPKLTFKFFAELRMGGKIELEECGVRWIYPSEDQIVDKGSGCQSKKSTEIYELGGSAFQNGVEGPESNQQEELDSLTNSFMQHGFDTSPNPGTQETEDLRLSVEEILHIGFGNENMKWW